MSYTLHREKQGSDEWLAGRNTRLNASELALAAGDSMNGRTRTDLIRKMATGIDQEIDARTQERFDEGHRFEALARPIAEQIIGRDLYPITVSIHVDGLSKDLGASLDGATDDDDTNFEHKRMNIALRAALSCGVIPSEYHWQMEQGQMINGATRTLFMASEWDDDGSLIEEMHVWYESNPELRARIVPIWKQAEADAANYQHVEAAPVAVADPIKDLPAIVVHVSGALTVETNFSAWGVELKSFIDRLPERIPEKLSTDQEFADCKAAIAAFKKAEAQLDAEESRVLSAVPDIDEMKRVKKLLREMSSTTRLILEKRATSRDRDVKIEIMQEGKDALAAHIAGLNKRLGKVQMPEIVADFSAAIKGKKLYSAMRGSVADLVAAKKIESNELADKIQINLNELDANKEYAFLFNDRATLVMKANDDLKLVIRMRISDHLAAEERRLVEEREKIRREEEAKAAAKLRAEQEAEAARRQKEIDDEAAQQRAAAEAAAAIERDRAATATSDLSKAGAQLLAGAVNQFADNVSDVAPQMPAGPATRVTRSIGSTSTGRPISTAINPAQVTEKLSRPDDHMIIGILSIHFRVHESKVVEWLLDMDLKAASDNILKEFAA